MGNLEKLRFPYPFLVTQIVNKDGTVEWEAEAIDLPGCVAGADTVDELFHLMAEAQAAWIESAKQDGLSLPTPCTSNEYSGKLTVRLPKALHRRVAILAKATGQSLNSFISTALAYAAGQEAGHYGGGVSLGVPFLPVPADRPHVSGTAFSVAGRFLRWEVR